MFYLCWGSIQEIVQDNIAKSLVRIIPIIRIAPANTNNLSHFPKHGQYLSRSLMEAPSGRSTFLDTKTFGPA